MKLHLLVTSFVICASAIAQNTWTQKATFGGDPRLGAVGFAIGMKGYIGTGYSNQQDIVLSDFWEWNPTTNTWTQKADFAGGIRGWAIGTGGYLGMGGNLISTPIDFWKYDTASNSWTHKAPFEGGPTSQSTAFTIGSKIYVLASNLALWEYDPSLDQWTAKADYPGMGITGQAGFAIGTKGYIGTGGTNDDTYVKDFWEYNPATDQWTQKANFGGHERIAAVGFAIGSRGYIGTGAAGNSNKYRDFWEYNPANDTWTQRASFGGSARWVATGFAIGNKGYIGLGFDNSGNRGDFWEYTPDATTGIPTFVQENPITASPNPVLTETTLRSSIQLEDATLTIYNALGHQVKELTHLSGKSIILQRDQLKSGIYFIRLTQNEKTYTPYKLLIKD